MPDRLCFTKNGVDILEGIELRNGKSNPFGWSTHEVWLAEQGGEEWIDCHIADIYCGSPINLAEGYEFRIEKEDKI